MPVRQLRYSSDTSYLLERAHPGDAGIDLFANDNVTIQPEDRVTIPTGIRIELPKGTYGKIESRSGLAAKHKLDVCAGVIDSNYRGELLVCLENSSTTTAYDVLKGDRIAQLIVQKYEILEPVLVEQVAENKVRGTAGFGSSGY